MRHEHASKPTASQVLSTSDSKPKVSSGRGGVMPFLGW